MLFAPELPLRRVLWASHVVLWVALALPVAAQLPGPGRSIPPPLPQPGQVKDPLGRSTPRGTITAFTRAAHDGSFLSAARYMQLKARQRPHAETLARDLNELMDRYFRQRVATISGSPEGALDDGLPLDREKVGPLEIGGKELDIELVRVKDPDAGEIWLISSATAAQVPALHDAIEKTWLEKVVPEALFQATILGVSLAQPIAWAASLGIPLFLLWLVSLVSLFLARKIARNPTDRRHVDVLYAAMRWPGILVLTLGIHLASLSALGFSLRFRITYSHIVAILLIIVLALLTCRLSTLTFDYLRSKLQLREQAGTKSLLLLGERVLKGSIILVAILASLAALGVDTSTVLAGLGIAGLALAAGARTTVENFLGGVFLLTDKAIAVGDMCYISNRLGFVEDITLRSVRFRTLEQTLLSIPAGVLSQEELLLQVAGVVEASGSGFATPEILEMKRESAAPVVRTATDQR